jgi:uncharacterized DUF497 family protein
MHRVSDAPTGDAETIRLISARPASRRERSAYDAKN